MCLGIDAAATPLSLHVHHLLRSRVGDVIYSLLHKLADCQEYSLA